VKTRKKNIAQKQTKHWQRVWFLSVTHYRKFKAIGLLLFPSVSVKLRSRRPHVRFQSAL